MAYNYTDASTFSELTLNECGMEKCLKDKMIVNKAKTYHLFHYCTDGKGYLEIDNHKYAVTQGMLFFIPMHYCARYYPDPNTPWTYFWIGFSGIYAEDILGECNLSLEHPIYRDSDGSCKNFFKNIYTAYSHRGYLNLECLGKMYELFSVITENNRKEKTSAELIVKLACDYIRNNYQFDLRIEDVARNVKVTPNYLSALFRSVKHISTKEYLTKIRMERALVILRTGSMNVREISKMVGYKDQLYFSKVFKKYYGVAPTQYSFGEIGEVES